VRDPRDRCISVERTWGKSKYRAAELWRREIQNCLKWKGNKEKYYELFYEDLVERTEIVLRDICQFLDIEFSDKMLFLDKPAEKHGENSKNNVVGSNSVSRYLNEDIKEIKRIEEICFPLMGKMGYNVKYASHFKPVSPFRMFVLRFMDFIKFKINVKKKGY
jgi:type I site-specific restriction endonuclease